MFESKNFIWLLEQLAVSENDIAGNKKLLKIFIPYTLVIQNQGKNFTRYLTSNRILIKKV